MNVSQPISSSLEKVNFGVLSPEEIRKLSVKRVTSSQTFDRLLHPITGGLYDPAFGAFTDHACTTCFLDQNHCPGHCGHIELPFPVYHVLFMDQAFRLFRAQCASCRGFRLSRVEVNLFWCKLRLIRHGLLKEAHEVEDIGVSAGELDNKSNAVDDNSSAEEDEDEDDSDQRAVISARRTFVERAIRRISKRQNPRIMTESESISEARKTVIREFIASLGRGRKCARCKMVTPSYRKNGYIGIFRKPLPAKDRAYNAQQGRAAAENPLVALNRIKEKQRKQREQAANGMEVDEGVADMDSPDEDQIRVFEGQPEIDGASTSESEGEDIAHSRQASPTVADQAVPKQSQKKGDKEPDVFVDAGWVHASLTQLFDNEREILTQVYGSMTKSGDLATPSPDQFFISCLVVPPNKYRKESRTGQDEIAESSDNEGYKMVLNACDELLAIRREMQGHEIAPGRRPRGYDQLQQQWLTLQNAVNTLIDSDKSGLSGSAALRIPEGIKQKLEKKEGMFRMNIMGKRVNFAARSVISPDPNIETREIGIPPVFARKLTYPEPVTPWSFEELKQAVINGATKWPGAVAIENENGQIVNLRRKTQDERAALANLLLAPSSTSVTGVRPKKVHRHLNNGDIVIMNRQPTLHKPSMMAHRARVLPGEKTIRMHYANCNTYNADFDGDEMNMHFPQNEIARAEALEIADTDHQYLSATAGNPLRGLIQDHISMGVWLTCLDTFFSKEDYQELLYSALRPEDDHTPGGRRIILLEPAVIKPAPRWTGKQIISTILVNIRPDTHAGIYSESKCSTPADRWGVGSQEGFLRVINNEVVTGILDKKQIGPTKEGLIHTVYEAYGHKAAGSLLSTLGRLLTRLESMRAFSCGVEDLVLTQKGEADRAEKLSGAKTIGLGVASKYVSLEDEKPKSDDPELLARLEMVLRDDKKQAGLDSLMNGTTSKLSASVTEACLPNGLIKKFPKNQMQAMTTSGAKGSMVNANLISCNLGQQVLEGRRVPIMASGKSLPSFKPFDSSVRAGGYIVDRFLTGVRPQEYYFHAMAGREGLIDTAVKTSRSGYLQRCVIKGMEGLRAEYDTTVRDSDGTIVQYLYGEDGLDITKQSSLFDLSFFTKNFLSLFASLNARDEQHVISEEAREWTKKAYKAYHKTANLGAMDPALAIFPPGAVGGSISEKFHTLVKDYLDNNPDGTLKDKTKKTGLVPRSTFRALCDINYMKAVVQPGEAIGVVAGQSIGEPSTQMTLNTFHLAGHSAKNVTLGIPRLREILMTASQNIKTPTMSLYLNPEMTHTDGERFAKGISRLSLAELVDDVAITETVGQGIYPESRKYKVVIKFYPSKDYIEGHAITIDDVVETVEHKFLPIFRRLVKAEFKRRNESKEPDKINKASSSSGIGKPIGRVREEEAAAEAENEGGDSDEDDDGDDDATTMKKRGQRDEGLTYEDPDEDEMEIERQGEREASPQAENATAQPVDEGYGGSPSGSQASDSDDEEDPKKAARRAAKDRAARIVNENAEVSNFTFDDSDGQVCSITFEYPASRSKLLLQNFVQRAASSSYVQAIPGIASAVYQKEQDQEGSPYLVFTEGVNFIAMREYQNVIDPHRMYTNDVGAVLRTYGVEAARDTIIRELNGVFKGHSISVDRRHLTLVADYMTRSGGYSAFSRIGMAHKTSPFAKMSFETTAAFLRDAVTEGDVEELASPSARITVGKIGQIGTGMCDVLMQVS